MSGFSGRFTLVLFLMLVLTAGLAAEGGTETTIESDHSAQALEFTPDGYLIGCTDNWSKDSRGKIINTSGYIRVWDPREKTQIDHMSGQDFYEDLDLARDGRLVAVGSTRGRLIAYELTSPGTGNHMWDRYASHRMITNVEISPDGTTLLTLSFDGKMRLWDMKTGESLWVVSHDVDITWGASFTSDGRYIVAATDDGGFITWDVAKRRIKATVTGSSEDARGLALSSNDKYVFISYFQNHHVEQRERKTGALVRTFPDSDIFAISSDNRFIATSETFSDTVIIREIRTGNIVHTIESHSDGITAIAWSPYTSQLATSAFDDKIIVTDLSYLYEK